jgi:hypothetical protein
MVKSTEKHIATAHARFPTETCYAKRLNRGRIAPAGGKRNDS